MPPPPPNPPIKPHIPPSLAPYNQPLSTYLTHPSTQKYSSMAVGALIFQLLTPKNATTETKILLLKRAATDFFPGIWEMPGGAVESTDASILAACAREVWEESGLRVKGFRGVVRPGGGWEWVDKGRWWGKVCFVVDVEGGEGEGVEGGVNGVNGVEVKLDPEEHQAFGWFTREEVRGLDLWFRENGEVVEEGFRVVEGEAKDEEAGS